MKLPQRHPNHVIETASWKALQAAIPEKWILREVTERDYGIDAYLELVTNDGFVTGDLVSLQLKGEEHVEWKEGKHSFTGTRTETVNYWMNLPVPVFLCVADTTDGKVWYVDVKDYVRRVYKELQTQKTLTFPIREACTLNTGLGLTYFVIAYVREKRHRDFSKDVTALLANCPGYAEFCEDRYHRDCHLALEPHNQLFFVHMHGVAQSVALHLGVEWKLKSIDELLGEDRRAWKDGSCDLHEGTAEQFVRDFAPKLADIILAARNHVSSTYADYWRAHDPLLFEACAEYSEFAYVIDQAVAKLRDLR